MINLPAIGDVFLDPNEEFKLPDGTTKYDLLLADGSEVDESKHPLYFEKLGGTIGVPTEGLGALLTDKFTIPTQDSGEIGSTVLTTKVDGGWGKLISSSLGVSGTFEVENDGTPEERIKVMTNPTSLHIGTTLVEEDFPVDAGRFQEFNIDLSTSCRLVPVGYVGGCVFVTRTEIVICTTQATGLTDSAWASNDFYGQYVAKIPVQLVGSFVTLAFDIEVLPPSGNLSRYNLWLWINGVAYPSPLYVVSLVGDSSSERFVAQMRGDSFWINAYRSNEVCPYTHFVDYVPETLPWEKAGVQVYRPSMDSGSDECPYRVVADLTDDVV